MTEDLTPDELAFLQSAFDLAREDDVVAMEFRRSLIRWAAARIRDEFREATWKAFWFTMVEGHEIRATASDLGMSIGSVYAARSRIIRRLKQEIEAHEHEFQGREVGHVDSSASR